MSQTWFSQPIPRRPEGPAGTPQSAALQPCRATNRSIHRKGSPRSAYDRKRDLPSLVAVWPEELTAHTPEGHQHLIQRLRRALREERRRGLAGHRAYDLNRHARLLAALRAEIASLPPPHSTWAARAFSPSASRPAVNPGVCRDPSSSPVASAPPRSSGPPSDSRAAAAILPGTLQATFCSGSADAV